MVGIRIKTHRMKLGLPGALGGLKPLKKRKNLVQKEDRARFPE